MSDDKINAYMTLYTALVTIAKTAAPMIPFMTEDIYRNLVCSIDKSAPESVHLCMFPEVNEDMIDKKLENDMEEALNIVVLGRAARNGSNMKNRQPLNKMFVKADAELSEYFVKIIEDELNIKQVEFCDDVASFMSYSFKPQLKTLGPKYGKQLGEIRAYLAEIDGSAAKAELDANGSLTLKLPSGDISVTEDDLLIDIKQKEGYFSLSDNGITVALDTVLTDELIEEGFVREIISKIQTMRKDAGFEVMDHIRVSSAGNDKIAELLSDNADTIKNDVLCDEIIDGKIDGFEKEWNINGENVTLYVAKI